MDFNKTVFAKKLFIIGALLLSLACSPLHALVPKVIQDNNGLEFWTESFGEKTNPALILVMGSGGQGLMWPQEFCEQLANKGYFVIRFDNRDTGLSASIDYEAIHYTLLDMTKDIVSIMDKYKIQKAHIVGVSMGGVMAQLFGTYYPDRALTLTLLATSSDMRPAFDSFAGKPTTSTLSIPKPPVLDSVKNVLAPPVTLDEKVALFMKLIPIYNPNVTIDKEFVRQQALQTFVRMRNPNGSGNHFQATQVSYELQKNALEKIKAPTLILHGDQDPVFAIDHANALHKAIPHSKLVIIPKFGHGFASSEFFTPIVDNIAQFAK